MLAVFAIIGFIVLANVVGFGSMLAIVKVQEAKEAKAIAERNAKALHTYRVRYGSELGL